MVNLEILRYPRRCRPRTRPGLVGLAFSLLLGLPAMAHQPVQDPNAPHPHGDETGHRPGSEHGLRHDFSEVAKWSERFDDPERDAWQRPEEVVDLLDITPGSTVVDLGAGTGYLTGYLSTAVGEAGRVLALDVEPNLVAHLEKRAAREGWTNVEARRVEMDDPGLEASSVDRVVILDTWHHIGHRVAYAGRLLAGLRPEGRVMVVDFTLDSPEGPPVEHRLSPEAVVEELTAAGFEASVVDEGLPRQYVVVGRVADRTP